LSNGKVKTTERDPHHDECESDLCVDSIALGEVYEGNTKSGYRRRADEKRSFSVSGH
jgi:hypothetical protein